jgi:soluble lytic murein transglycosylase-like protein
MFCWKRTYCLVALTISLTLSSRWGLAADKPNVPPGSNSFELAVRYENGEGVLQDYAHALQLYCDAANEGNADAYFNLGWMYANGRGVPRDDGIAVGWLRKAALAGVPQAANLIAMLGDTPAAANLGCAPPPPPAAVWHSPPQRILHLVEKIAAIEGVDPRLVLAVIAAESDFDDRAVSPKKALGLMQLMPDTANHYGVRDPFDSEQNIRGGTAYLRWLLHRFAGDLSLTLAAYNAGEEAVQYYGGVPPYAETIEYVARIKAFYEAETRSNRLPPAHR